MITRVFSAVSLLLLAFSAPAYGATAHVPLPVELDGILNGAEYAIRVPANWNGTLIVYARGGGEGVNLLLAEHLLPQGYALASSSFGPAFWEIKAGIQNTLALTNYFKGHIGTPDRIILWGRSNGGMVTAKIIEKYPAIYDGGISVCGVLAGTSEFTDQQLEFGLAYDVTFGWLPEWGSVEDVRDDLDFWNDVVPLIYSQLMDPSNAGKWEFMRLVSDLPPEGFYDMSPFGFPWAIGRVYNAIGMRAEIEAIAGGPTAENHDHTYSLDDAEKAYLSGLGIDADDLLQKMNARTNISARIAARHNADRYASFSGIIKRPVLTIHTKDDPMTLASQESVYRDAVESAGSSDFLLQVYTVLPFPVFAGHCMFTDEQLLRTVEAMEQWLDTGVRPDESFFDPAMGFLPGFVPPPWRY